MTVKRKIIHDRLAMEKLKKERKKMGEKIKVRSKTTYGRFRFVSLRVCVFLYVCERVFKDEWRYYRLLSQNWLTFLLRCTVSFLLNANMRSLFIYIFLYVYIYIYIYFFLFPSLLLFII